MSFTLTIESPEKAAWFEEQKTLMSPQELGELFCVFLAERHAKRLPQKSPVSVGKEHKVSPRVQALCGVITLPDGFDERKFKAERLVEKLEV